MGSVEISEEISDAYLAIHDSDRELITPTGAPTDEVAEIRATSVQEISESDDQESIEVQPDASQMKRSHEMVFNTSQQAEEMPKELSESRETLNASIITVSSTSDTTVLNKEEVQIVKQAAPGEDVAKQEPEPIKPISESTSIFFWASAICLLM